MVRPLSLLLLVLLALPAAARAAEPAGRYNANGQLHALVCVPLAGPSAPLRYTDGSETGFQISNQQAFNDGRCPSNTVRLDYHEAFPLDVGSLVFHRGGNGYVDEQNVKYGQILTSDLGVSLPEPVPSGGGRGAPCARLAAEPAYRVDVRTIPAEMHYKHPSELPSGSNRGSSFEHYGDPGADQGDRTDIHYTYLLWSFLNVRGGGIVRTLLKPDQVIRACDVEPVTMPSWDREGNVNGSVTARYVRALAGTCPLHGWTVWSHTYAPEGVPVAHTAVDGPPGPDPAPRDDCPSAAPAAPPTVSTGEAGAVPDGTATLTGTVHPEGTPTTYRFEYGGDAGYGSSSEERAVSVAPRTNAVSVPVAGLQPGATYHSRIVAIGEHGTSAGEDRTFTVPLPPPPPPAPPPPPPPEPVALSELRLTPSPMRRSRHRLGTSARISFRLTKPATVTLTFLRATSGMRVGSTCRHLPKQGLPRGRRRCTLWGHVPGSLRRAAQAGPGAVRFGGWIGRRRLPLGRYRLQALPSDGGPPAVARVAGFRLR
jgi:hypothetical protein